MSTIESFTSTSIQSRPVIQRKSIIINVHKQQHQSILIQLQHRPSPLVWNVHRSTIDATADDNDDINATTIETEKSMMVRSENRRSILTKVLPSAFAIITSTTNQRQPQLLVATAATTNIPAVVTSKIIPTKPVYANDNDIMYPKEHGTSMQSVQDTLLYNVNVPLADKICNYNRHFAEPAGYFTSPSVSFLSSVQDHIDNHIPQMTFYDSVTGVPLFTFVETPQRTYSDFLMESQIHGWPSFRDVDVQWDHVRILTQNRGEVVSTTGTHLGHNLPDKVGNRYCINLVSIAGQPLSSSSTQA